ncbi:MAG: arylsulfatase [Planctomycetota bacterium]|nr:arylsulfatase [Planctomycetota bacterium]
MASPDMHYCFQRPLFSETLHPMTHLMIHSTTVRLFLILIAMMPWLASQTGAEEPQPPNIVLILADDLGYNELGCYGQTKIRTPRIDQLAREGMKFTQHYSGSPVCASSRCVLMTGLHTGHAFVRGNKEMGGWGPDEPEGQLPIPDETVTLAERLKKSGYATGAFGKWGLGGPGSTGHPCYQGFDRFYGLLCQRVAHNYYPTHLWSDHDVDVLGNRYFSAHQKLAAPLETEGEYYDQYQSEVYAPDRMIEEALKFVDANQKAPFFLYYATPVPHVSLQVPNDSLKEYEGAFPETPYLGQKAYLPHPTPRAAYAAMITRMDQHIGQLMDRIESLGLSENTIFIFTSDNGPTFNGGSDSKFFDSSSNLRGLKVDVFEGGIRVPMIVRWPAKVKSGTTSDHVSSFQDFTPTLLEITGTAAASETDGISFLPTLMGQPQPNHEFLYWELGRQQAVRAGDWKLVRKGDAKGNIRTMLFNLAEDVGEQEDLSEQEPNQLSKRLQLAEQGRTQSPEFPSIYDSKPDSSP